MYRIMAAIEYNSGGNTQIPTFYLNPDVHPIPDETAAIKYALDVIDPMGLIQSNPNVKRILVQVA